MRKYVGSDFKTSLGFLEKNYDHKLKIQNVKT